MSLPSFSIPASPIIITGQTPGLTQSVPVIGATTGGSPTTTLKVPAGAVALVGFEVAANAANVAHGALLVTWRPAGTTQDHQLVGLSYFLGTTSAMGCAPLNPNAEKDTFLVQTFQAVSTDKIINVNAIFLMSPVWYPLPAIPFKGNNDQEGAIVLVTGTSAVTTAQTLTATTLTSTSTTSADGIELVDAWFYTTSTATGTLSFFDGTTKVTIDSTTAVASYAFNVGKLGPRQRLVSNGATAMSFKLDIGAPGASTTTAFLLYRAFCTR